MFLWLMCLIQEMPPNLDWKCVRRASQEIMFHAHEMGDRAFTIHCAKTPVEYIGTHYIFKKRQASPCNSYFVLLGVSPMRYRFQMMSGKSQHPAWCDVTPYRSAYMTGICRRAHVCLMYVHTLKMHAGVYVCAYLICAPIACKYACICLSMRE